MIDESQLADIVVRLECLLDELRDLVDMDDPMLRNRRVARELEREGYY